MILNSQQALEIGEALIDAAHDTTRYGREHVVATICGDEVAISMILDDDLKDFGYEHLITVKAS
jgi:hypothetical protein